MRYKILSEKAKINTLIKKSFILTKTYNDIDHKAANLTKQNKQHCYDSYGFVSDPELTLRSNKIIALRKMPIKIYFNSPLNLTFHNLCSKLQPPSGLGCLLGLGQKFIIQKKNPKLKLEETLEDIIRDVRLKYFFAGEQLENEDFNPKLYLKTDWDPPAAADDIEKRLSEFCRSIREHKNLHSSRPATNISRLQYRALKFLKNNKDFIVALADKNLGPILIERDEYVRRVFKDHLSNEATYTQISLDEARKHMAYHRKTVGKLFLSEETLDFIRDEDKTFFKRLFKQDKFRRPTFYILFKIHKKPWATRPVVSCCGSLLAAVSTWLDVWLQKIKHLIPGYLKDSVH